MTSWLTDITKWLGDALKKLWDALVQLWQDAFLWVFEQVLSAWAMLVEALPVPDLLTTYSLGGLFAALPPEVLYFAGLFKVPEGLAMIGAGVAFNLLRKLFTLGQW